MKATPSDTTTTGATGIAKRPHTTTSKDGRWRTFHKHAGLMQFIPAGTYYARCKVRGKAIRASLRTEVFTAAKLRLPDKLRELRKPKTPAGTFGEARALYEADLAADHTLAEGSRQYRKARIAALLKTWPGEQNPSKPTQLDETNLSKITETDCREWAKRFSAQFDEQNFNNTLGTLRAILEKGGLGRDENPAFKIKRLGVKPTDLQLPEPAQFEKILGNGGNSGCATIARLRGSDPLPGVHRLPHFGSQASDVG